METIPQLGDSMHRLMAELFPQHRSITGSGVRRTLQRLAEDLPLKVLEVPTGTTVFDWEVPLEWQIQDAYIADQHGHRWVDYRHSNLHVVNYSRPLRKRLSWSELQPHLHTLPEHPDWIPYRTAYFRDMWGFCLPYRVYQQLEQDPAAQYEVVIDAEFQAGSISLGEVVLPGQSQEEFLVYAHTCHPSLANDNLSGIVVAAHLARCLSQQPRRYTYRFVFAPATIGAITWLHQRREQISRIRHGLVLALLGDAAGLTYKRSRRGNAEIDRAAACVLQTRGRDFRLRDYTPTGYDERQLCAPAFDLPVGCLMRSLPGEFAEHHTSADNLEFVKPEALQESLEVCLAVVESIENNRAYRNRFPHGEPQLGRRDLYGAVDDDKERERMHEAILWMLNLSDGRYTLLDIAERSGLAITRLHAAARVLQGQQLLNPLGPPSAPFCTPVTR